MYRSCCNRNWNCSVLSAAVGDTRCHGSREENGVPETGSPALPPAGIYHTHTRNEYQTTIPCPLFFAVSATCSSTTSSSFINNQSQSSCNPNRLASLNPLGKDDVPGAHLCFHLSSYKRISLICSHAKQQHKNHSSSSSRIYAAAVLTTVQLLPLNCS